MKELAATNLCAAAGFRRGRPARHHHSCSPGSDFALAFTRPRALVLVADLLACCAQRSARPLSRE